MEDLLDLSRWNVAVGGTLALLGLTCGVATCRSWLQALDVHLDPLPIATFWWERRERAWNLTCRGAAWAVIGTALAAAGGLLVMA